MHIKFDIVYCFTCRNEFASYLCRPDHKQEFVSQWQSSYNSLEAHLRREDAMKAELHHRVDVSSVRIRPAWPGQS